MRLRHSRVLLAAVLAAIAAVALGAAVAPALTTRAAPQKITPTGVGKVKLGMTYRALRTAGLVGTIRPGCPLAGPNTRSARLLSPLKGGVDFSQTAARKVTAIFVTGGATARGVGVGATVARIKQAFPQARLDHTAEDVFGITIAKVPKSGGGRIEFAVSTTTHKTTQIAVPGLQFCD
jgi:hypothetical protein